MAHAMTFGTYDFTDKLADAELDDPKRIPTETVAQRHGVVITEAPTRDKKTIHLYGTLRGSTPGAVKTARDAMLFAFNNGRQKLSFNGGTRWIYCYNEDTKFHWVKGSGFLAMRWDAVFIADDPFWYEAEVTQDQVVVSSGLSWTVLNNGDEPVFPVVTVIANAGTISSGAVVENLDTLKRWTFNASVASGTNLVVDHGNFTVYKNAANALASWAAGSLFFKLNAGSNNIFFAGSNCTVRIQHTPRFNGPAET